MKKSKNLKNFLWVFLAFVICFVVFYFVWAFLRLNDKGLSEDFFVGKTYQSLDGETVLTFGAIPVLRRGDNSFDVVKTVYEDNIFSFETEAKTLYFLVLEGGLMYCNAWNVYMYEVTE